MIKSKKLNVATILMLLCTNMSAVGAEIDLGATINKQNACFLLEDLGTGKKLVEYNKPRCDLRVPPQSSFKFPAAIMGFEAGVLTSADQAIKWDGTKHSRAVDNQDQTQKTWMSNSSIWVTRWLMPQLGIKTIDKYLNDFKYGNKDFSGGMDKAWVSSTLKISAYEQLDFLKRFWHGQLSITKKTQDQVKEVLFISKSPGGALLYGKTGTGCINGTACMNQPDKMLGWFVGFVVNGKSSYAFVANAEDLESEKEPAGPRLRKKVTTLLEQMKLLN